MSAFDVLQVIPGKIAGPDYVAFAICGFISAAGMFVYNIIISF